MLLPVEKIDPPPVPVRIDALDALIVTGALELLTMKAYPLPIDTEPPALPVRMISPEVPGVVGATGTVPPNPAVVTDNVPPLVVTAAIAFAICCATELFDGVEMVTVDEPEP